MNDFLKNRAEELLTILQALPGVQKCSLYGSLSANTHDEFSDIDIEIDVSGQDNGLFCLSLPGLLKDKLPVYYWDYAPSLVPERYIVSFSLDENNPFLIADLCCSGLPHCTTVTKEQLRAQNDPVSHLLKLWTANLKHYARGADCYGDIPRMAHRAGIPEASTNDAAALLEETLCFLERSADDTLEILLRSCRRKFEELLKSKEMRI